MVNRFVVSTECPTCGAPLDFAEGSHAVQCSHCQSNLLVTGRKQVLSYYICPKVDKHRAVAIATLGLRQKDRRWRAVKRQLYFIPYYRLTGQDFIWEKAPSKRKPPPDGIIESAPTDSLFFGAGYGTETNLDSVIESGINLLMKTFKGSPGARQPKKTIPAAKDLDVRSVNPSLYPAKPYDKRSVLFADNDEFQFHDQYVEKNFVACDLLEFGLYSLGVRPAVLRLELFRRKVLEEMGRIVSVKTSPDFALSHGMKTGSSNNIIYRQVLGRMLSVIYFPFWVVELEYQGKVQLAIVDAVSESVIKLDRPPSLYTILDHGATSDPPVIGFRPLTCPNCGWDLPVDPDNFIFFCSSCQRAWQIGGSELSQVPYEIAERPSPGDLDPVKYLPFWVIQSELKKRPFRFFLPAFRYRRLKFLSDLAIKIGRIQPSYSVLTGEVPEVHGCYYDQEDAILLAQFIYAGLASGSVQGTQALRAKKFNVTASTLTWFPFKEKAHSLRDPFLGLPLPQNLLL